MNKIPVLVSIQSCAKRDDDTEEPITMMLGGEMTLVGEKAIITYQETLDESLPTQMVMITAQDDVVTMQRLGDYATQMVFCRGQRYEGAYQTPYGEMEMAVFCTRLQYDLSEQGGQIQLTYQMDLNGQFSGMHQMNIQVMVRNG